ncbi:hypothetical protein OS493_015469 [Desmophyllum pertusum]|uniref:Neurotransmitter-gated ion-channel ligand-binding domain-containing protein n=1 Tax=Desmophyllum pertusum TaxID=174260 RepID=A0A9W9Z486_9CNID|nr:hypothetical protein OS493_015469 [Desmophyllum pertusum]
MENSVTATLGTPEQRLRHDLLSKYHHDIRPVIKPGDVINISFSYQLGRIVSLVRSCYVTDSASCKFSPIQFSLSFVNRFNLLPI